MLRRRGVGATLVAVALVATSSLVDLVTASAAEVNGTVLLNEEFGGTTVADPALRALNDACLTRSTTQPPATAPTVSNLGKCTRTTGTPDTTVNPGFLQLTDVRTDARGGIVYNQALPGNAGLQMEFEQFQYGGNGADGITFFLVDGAVDLDNVGAYGGSLGYAQRNSEPGVNGGYIGVGLDVYGNYANDSEARGRGCPAGSQSPVAGSTRIQNAVIIRGPQDASDPTRATGYCYLAGTVNGANNATTLPGALHGSGFGAGQGRKVRITVSPDAFPRIEVEIDFEDGAGYRTVLTHTMATQAPATWKFGLAASTGGSTDAHLIRGVEVETVVPLSGINLVKQVDKTQQQPPSYTAGDTVPYQFVVTNGGLNTLHDVVVTDPRVSPISCPRTTLAPAGSVDATMTCTGSYRLLSTDTDTETSFTNTAQVTGFTPSNQPLTATDTVTIPITAKPSITIEKNAALAGGSGNLADVGEQIRYTFTVTNTGNVPLTGVAVADSKVTGETCAVTPLAPLESTTCTASPYTVSQADVDAGSVDNTATARGTPPSGGSITSAPDTASIPTSTPNPDLIIEKTATLEDIDGGIPDQAEVGETIDYAFEVTNTGNVTLTGVGVNDSRVGTVSCTAATLAPAATTTCTAAPYAISQADIDAGVVHNEATARGTPPSGTAVTSEPDEADVPTVAPQPVLTLTKQADLNDADGNELADVGETIEYSFTATNAGNVTLSAIAVTDSIAGPVTCSPTTIGPGQSSACTAENPYEVTQADVDAGIVHNEATAQGQPPGDGDPVTSNQAVTDTPVPAALPALTITKAADLDDTNENQFADAGETIAYSFVVENTGNVTITDVAVEDDRAGAVTCDETELAPDETTSCTADAEYTVTQADVDNGSIVNTATATGQPPDGPGIESPPDQQVVPATTAEPALVLDKTADLDDENGNGFADAGETIQYSFEVTNNGNVTLNTTEVDDSLAGSVTCEETTLAPGASTACDADEPYTVTQADVDAGAVENVATATGEPPDGDTVESNEARTVTPTTPAAPGLALGKLARLDDTNGNGTADVGETVAYTFRVRNTGNVTITGLAIDDPNAEPITCVDTTLAPGGFIRCTADAGRVVTQADVDAGFVRNLATATGTDSDGEDVISNEAKTDVHTTRPTPRIFLRKSATLNDANANGLGDLGETISYVFRVRNIGNVTLTGVTVDDPLVGPVSCPPASLAPRAFIDCTAFPYPITQADVDEGRVLNTATASGSPPVGPDVMSRPSRERVPTVEAAPGLVIEKRHVLDDTNDNGVADLGEAVDYTFTVTNTGNVTITGLAVNDATVGSVSCDETTLSPGAATDCRTDNAYVVTQPTSTAVRSTTRPLRPAHRPAAAPRRVIRPPTPCPLRFGTQVSSCSSLPSSMTPTTTAGPTPGRPSATGSRSRTSVT